MPIFGEFPPDKYDVGHYKPLFSRNLALRQGPWKLVYFKDGKRELYNLQTDLSETKNVLAANPVLAAKMTALIQSYIDNGRSTPGAAQKHDFDISLTGSKTKGKRNAAAQKPEDERSLQMELAADASFD